MEEAIGLARRRRWGTFLRTGILLTRFLMASLLAIVACEEKRMIRTLLIDNADSFTLNLFHLLAEINECPPTLVSNDWAEFDLKVLDDFDNVVISPGPGTPERSADFGICAEVIAGSPIPVLGVCLGHQGIAAVHGG